MPYIDKVKKDDAVYDVHDARFDEWTGFGLKKTLTIANTDLIFDADMQFVYINPASTQLIQDLTEFCQIAATKPTYIGVEYHSVPDQLGQCMFAPVRVINGENSTTLFLVDGFTGGSCQGFYMRDIGQDTYFILYVNGLSSAEQTALVTSVLTYGYEMKIYY